jgi:hypothetical protein
MAPKTKLKMFEHNQARYADHVFLNGEIECLGIELFSCVLCLSPLNDWTDFLIQFRTLNLGNHE